MEVHREVRVDDGLVCAADCHITELHLCPLQRVSEKVDCADAAVRASHCDAHPAAAGTAAGYHNGRGARARGSVAQPKQRS